MSTATCPACGVAVVPGYVKCPKCHKPLPKVLRAQTSAGGTAVEQATPLPIGLIVGGGVLIVGAILFFALHGGGKTAPAVAPATAPAQQAPQPLAQAPVPSNDITPVGPPPSRPSPDAAAADLEHQLKHQRLWSTVEVVGDHADVRSGSCGDAALANLVVQESAAFKAGGLTHVRCLEQSGHVVFDRNL